MTVIQKASREEMIRVVHAAMFPQDVVHRFMNDAVRFVKAAETLGLIRFDGETSGLRGDRTAIDEQKEVR